MGDSSGIYTLMQKVNKELLENLRKNLKIIECLNELEKIVGGEF